jgi:hypothetical protein
MNRKQRKEYAKERKDPNSQSRLLPFTFYLLPSAFIH